MPHHPDQRRRELAAIADRIRGAVYTAIADLEVTAWVTPEPVPFSRREEGERKELRPGDKWGDLFDCAWFRFGGRIPEEAAGRRVVLLIDLNGEALVVDAEGRPVIGLTSVSSSYDYSLGRPGKRVVPIAGRAEGGAAIEVWADAGCNDLFGELRENGTLKEARVAVCHPELHALQYDWEVLLELMRELPEHSAQRHSIFAALDRAAIGLRDLTDEEARAARAILAPELARRGGDPALSISAIGHAHMDLAWLWPIRETIRKGARTFATALRMMERYPTYHFGASQPQLYQWMKEHHPSLYAEVRERVRDSRWEAQGAMWVEADTNVPGGEALVRQIIYGKRFFREEFGVDPRVLWLPDVFGYSAALPQILRQAGVEWFMTQKLSWNTVNRFPHHTFHWQGLDGSEVLAHMLPEETYNSSAAPRALAKAERNFAEKGRSPECLLLFGIGDGGGGPGEEHIERLLREENLAGLPPVRQEPSERFFERIAADTASLPSWVGELYLERHQGTYTTQARSKRCNRKMELALREAEWACARAAALLGEPYPADKLEAIWKEVLLYQFHDILPGSSITRVYDESLARYEALLAETGEITARAEERLASRINARGCAKPVIVWNSLSWERGEWLKIDGRWCRVTVPALGYAVVDTVPQVARAIAGATMQQRLFIDLTAEDIVDPYEVVKRLQADPKTRGVRVVMRPDFDALKRIKADPETRDIPVIMLTPTARAAEALKGWQAGFDSYLDEVISPPRQTAGEEVVTPLTASERVLENDLLRAEFAEDGSVASVFDKEARREVIAPGSAGNRLALYADEGDAWDFALGYAETPPDYFVLVESEARADGPEATVRHTYAYGASTFTQTVTLHAESRRVDFVTEVDWQETGKMLRTSFPLAVHASDVTCEIQFGAIKRPTHRNTSWDVARDEICAHKWIDLSERGWGVALLNDCKYGHKAHGNVLDLNLLRSPGWPDPKADRARHVFTYSLYPHSGDWAEGGVARAAYELNVPLRVTKAQPRKGAQPKSASLLSVSAPNVIVEAVKKAEDGDDLIVRLYEAHGQTTTAEVELGLPYTSAALVDLMEEHPKPLAGAGPRWQVLLAPFQIRTLRLSRGG